MYSTAIGDQILWFLEAFDHVIAQVQDRRADIRIISLSVVDISGCAFAPLGALSVASRTAVEAGILPVWAYGNYGAEPGTCSAAATAPYVLGVGASRGRGPVSSFSSRGLPNGNHDRERALANLEAFLAADESTRRMWDDEARPVGLFRPSLVAPGVDVISTQGPAGKYNTNSLEADPYYGRSSGTSMATPHVAGVVALVIQAHETNHPGQRLTPLDLIRLLEVTADRDHLIGSLAFEGGAGLVDALEAVTLAAAGRIPPAVTSDHLLPETLGPADLRKTFRGSSPPQSRELNVGYTLVDIPVPDGVARLDIRIDAPAPAMLRLYPPGRNPDAAFVFLENVDWGTDSASVGAPWKGTWVLRVDNTGGPFTGIWEIRYAQPAAPPEHEPRVLGAPTPQTLPATGLSSSSSVVGALLLGAAVALRRIGRTPATRSGALRATSPSFPG
jgi:subtilisin family serine protease